MGSTITLIEAVKTAVEPVIDSFKNAYSRLDAALEQIRKSAYRYDCRTGYGTR